MIEVRDDVGRLVVLARPARRVVSLVPSLTETVFALGCGEAVVGATRFCTEPAGPLANVEKVGGTKNPDVRRIIALRPDLVIVNAEENRKEDFSQLAAAGLAAFVAFSRHAADVPGLIERIGHLLDASVAARRMVAELQAVLETLHREPPARRPRVFCPIWKNPWMSFNGDTYTDDILWVAGGLNVCREAADRYCRVTLEEIGARAPEVILLPDEPYVFAAKDLPDLAVLHETPAVRDGRVHLIDGKALGWYGPRTGAGLCELHRLLV